MSDQGNQHNNKNGPHQDQIFNNPSALCLALWAKYQIQFQGWGGVADTTIGSLWREYDFLSPRLKKINKKSCHVYSVEGLPDLN